MKKSTKLMYGMMSKGFRRAMHELDRKQLPKFNMDHTVPRPQFVRDRTGRLVRYEGT